ncbi:hypothetical protein NEOC65_000811 [Neochlamydia sp. AcF65]|nr:hypothetical protein [Neochlamydia sp. AcF65]MBS4171127.1 hypothetical protein [Neochlamydia sp. AcF95]
MLISAFYLSFVLMYLTPMKNMKKEDKVIGEEKIKR